MTTGEQLTAGQVGERLGVKAGMVRRYALALESVTGISLEVDPVRGRLYPPSAVELLEATRAHLLTHPGASVEAAMRAVTGQGESSEAAPVRVPGMLTSREDLAELLREALAPSLAPILEELTSSRGEVEALRLQLAVHLAESHETAAALRAEAEGLRAQLAHLEVMTHAALPSSRENSAPEPTPFRNNVSYFGRGKQRSLGVYHWLIDLLTLRR